MSKGQTNTTWGFQGSASRRMVAPEAVLNWVRHKTKDDMGLGYQILDELKISGVKGIVFPYRPWFVETTAMKH